MRYDLIKDILDFLSSLLKVFDFKQHGINDGVRSTNYMWFIDFSHEGWHRYRLTMNDSEVEEHRIESGEEFLLITAKVRFWPILGYFCANLLQFF